MTTFVLVILLILALNIFGNAAALYMQKFDRKPEHLVVDIFLNLALLIWAAYLLGGD
jgi:hypothetical protein